LYYKYTKNNDKANASRSAGVGAQKN